MKVNLGCLSQIAIGEGREFVVDGKDIVVFRPRTGGVFATQAKCPHGDAPLCDGIVGGTTVICPYHSRKFDIATGASANPDCASLVTYPVRETDEGELLLTL